MKNIVSINKPHKEIKMKQTLKTLIRNVKSIKGNSLAEFATTTALMATLAATAAPKLSEMSEGAKAQKSIDELDKLVKQAGQFYQDTANEEGRGRFPGQDKYNEPVSGGVASGSGASISYTAHAATSGTESAHETAILADIGPNGTYTTWKSTNSGWISVFGIANADFPAPAQHTIAPDDTDDIAVACNTCPQVDTIGKEEWLKLFGGEPLGSQYQDGHFVYQVVAGYGTGNTVYPPVLYVADIENGANFNNVLEP